MSRQNGVARMADAAGGIRRVALTAALLVLLNPGRSFGQAASYGTEEVEGQEEAAGSGEGLRGGSADVAPPQIPGASSIGSARSGVRERGNQSTMLRYDQHREITPPEYATIRIGPFYSNIGISQSVGARFTQLSGAGVDYLEGTRRGDILKGGAEIPLETGLTLNNYMIITRHLDFEANIGIHYNYFPMKTQEDELWVDLTDEGAFATFSSQFNPSRDSKVLVYDDILYRTDYVDTRGFSDRYGGNEFKHLQNTAGLDWDWKPTGLDSFSGAASRRDTIPFDSKFDNQKGATYAEMMSYRRSFTPYMAGGLLGTASQSFYEKDRPDAFIYGLSAFAGVRLSPRLTGDSSLGYQFSTTSGGVGESVNNSSMVGSAGLNHEISPDRNQRLSYQRSMTEAFNGGVDVSDTMGYNLSWSSGLFPGGFSSSYARYQPQSGSGNGYADWTTGLNINHQLTRIMKLSLGAAYAMRMNDPVVVAEDAATAQADLTSDYQTLTLSASTGFHLTRNTILALYASHADRTSDNENMIYTRDTIGATVTWSHQF